MSLNPVNLVDKANPVQQSAPGAGPRRLTRRAFLVRVCGGGVVAGLGAGAYAHYVEPFWPAVERLDLDLPDLAPALQGLRVVQISDLHLGSPGPFDYLRAQVERCRALEPELMVVTGDFIHAADLRWSQALVSLLRPLQAPLGVFAILGNHDFGVWAPNPRPRGPAIAARIEQLLLEAGLIVLRNGAQVVMRGDAALQLVGIDDQWSGYCDPDQAFADADPDLPTVVLTHNPDTVPSLKDKRYDWALCGHTHGGQVQIPLIGAPILPIKHRHYDAGRFETDGHRLYVNRGLGSLYGVRFNCRPEITVFTLTGRA
jgi:hypothetical protein